MPDMPSGTATFLFTDLENSTRLWEQFPEAMRLALARHDALMKQAVESHHGRIVKTTGDGLHAVFDSASEGASAALAAQQALHTEAWPQITGPLNVRMGLHTGECQEREGDYYGIEVNRAARVMGIAHGGQILVSEVTAALIRNALPLNASLANLGEHRLKGLSALEQIFQLSHPDLPATFPPLNSSATATAKDNLPIQLTSFVGREKEIAEIRALLNSSRLVTLTGSGGTGKTRLSVEVGAQELDHFANGVWLIELAPLSDQSQIIPALAQIFGLRETPFAPLAALVTDYLRAKKILLILDNCEHLIATCARLADDLLHQCAGLKILASSREALGIAGEVAYRTPSLAETESTRLFVERAQAANPKFALGTSNASAIAQICARLDGIPLAVELAAARTKLFSVDQIAARLDDLFRLLVGGSRTALPRQQTLRALIDWSYDLLSEEERQLLRMASVFLGGWTLDALEAVSQDPQAIEHLEGLVNKCLVVTDERSGEMRYFLLETIRQYAREKLFDVKQTAAARDRHLIYFEALSEEAWHEFRQGGDLFMRDRAVDELDNLRAALEWGLAHHAEAALHLAGNLGPILDWLGKQTEGRALIQAALKRVRALPPAQWQAQSHRQQLIAKALLAEGTAACRLGDAQPALEALQKAIELSRLTGDKIVLAYSLEQYIEMAQNLKLPGASEAAEEGLTLMTELGDRYGLFLANLNKAWVAWDRGESEERKRYMKNAEALMKDMSSSLAAVAYFYVYMGLYERFQGNRRAARPYYEESLKAYQKLGQKYSENVARSELGHIARISGELAQAKAIYKQTLLAWQDLGSRAAIANQFECLAFIAVAEERAQRAAKLLGAAEALRDSIQSSMTHYERVEYDESLTQLRTMLPEADFNTHWAAGRALTMEQAIGLALEEIHD